MPNDSEHGYSDHRTASVGARGPLVVVAEDEASILTTTCAALSREGFRVLAASTCDDALAFLRRFPDVQALVTDVVTPGRVDGYELARIASAEFPRVAILITSAQSRPRYGDVVLGAWFVAKPVDLSALGRIVLECLEATRRKIC